MGSAFSTTAAGTDHNCPECCRIRKALEGHGLRLMVMVIRDDHFGRMDCPYIRLFAFAVSELRLVMMRPHMTKLDDHMEVRLLQPYDAGRVYLNPAYQVGFGFADNARGPIRLIPNGPIDTTRVRQWIATCESGHDGRCAEIGKTLRREDATFDSLFPGLQVLRLINLSEGRLEEFGRDGPPPPRYATLSYVWGGAVSFRLRSANKADLLTRKGSLALGRLPKTIVDTMDLLRQLGEQYLWVDALCLVQNDPDDVQLGVAIMDRVFEAAAFTVAAAGGPNADSGLDGFRSGSARFSRRKQCVEVVCGRAMAVFTHLAVLLETTVWSKRAWTFQEQILSRRILYFVDQQVSFHCPARLSSEWLVDSVSNFPESTRGLTIGGIHPSNRSPLKVFESLLPQYTGRKLTFEDDAMRAMAGIIRRFSESPELQGGFFQGIPRSSFDSSLLFSSVGSSSTRRRRGFPSYSWTGWTGPLEYSELRHTRSMLEGWLGQYTWITWFSTPPSSPGAPTLVWDPSAMDDSLFSLPQYEGYPRSRQRPLHRQAGLTYPAERAKVMPTKLPAEIRGDLQYPLLQFWTFTVFYRIRSGLEHARLERTPYENPPLKVAYIVDRKGDTLGPLYLDGFDDFHYSNHDSEKVFEFILLSQCNRTGELGYYVMYLEWMASGVAERRGVGIVGSPEAISQGCVLGPVWKEIVLA